MNVLDVLNEEKETADLVLVRGIPGSGKSTYVKNNLKGYTQFESDDFFTKDGKYKIDLTKLGQAHKACQNNVRKALKAGKKVAVSNTLTRQKEVNEYLKIAKELDKTVKIIRMTTQFKNQHNVPEETVQKMKNRMVDIDGEVKV